MSNESSHETRETHENVESHRNLHEQALAGLSAGSALALSGNEPADTLAAAPAAADAESLDPAANEAAGIVGAFMDAWHTKDRAQSDQQWLASQFRNYPELWSSDAEIETAAQEVTASIGVAHTSKASLNEALIAGQSRAGWFANEFERFAAAKGVTDVGAYAGSIESALDAATRNSSKVILRADGAVNGCTNLDGFIAEQHHVDSFNIDAVTKGSRYRAEVLSPEPGQPYRKNSVDIVIRDADGKVVRRYQSKYGADADTTKDLFTNGDYRGQRKLVPEGHSETVRGSGETIEIDGVSSKPFSKEQAKQQQNDAQQNGESKCYDWEQVNRRAAARQILKSAALAAAISVGFQAAFMLGRRAWNAARGVENPAWRDDLMDFLAGSLVGAANAGMHTAFAGAMVIAVKRGLLGSLLKQTAPGRIASAAFIALENAKVLWKLGKGEITAGEALDAIGETTAVTLISMIAMAEGAATGAAIGLVFGPLGAAIGGFTGGLVAGMAGSVAGKAIYNGAKTLCAKGAEFVANTYESAKETAGRVFGSVLTLFSA